MSLVIKKSWCFRSKYFELKIDDRFVSHDNGVFSVCHRVGFSSEPQWNLTKEIFYLCCIQGRESLTYLKDIDSNHVLKLLFVLYSRPRKSDVSEGY
jgi:hypothetical protein